MRILITSGGSDLSQLIASSLSHKYDVTLTDHQHVSTPHRFVQCKLDNNETTRDLVNDIQTIVHLGHADTSNVPLDQLDVVTRCTYNLLCAAADKGVRRMVFLSSLSLFDKYDPTLTVTETWQPMPTTNMAVLCHHLGEYVCREFAREGRIQVVCLRLGEITPPDAITPTHWSSNLYGEDATSAVNLAIDADLPVGPYETLEPKWSIFHIQSDVTRPRYTTRTAQKILDFRPSRRMK